ncbi:MAG: phosphotransferase [Halovenus sp.]
MTGHEAAFSDERYRRATGTALAAVGDEKPRKMEPLDRGNRKRTAVARYPERGPVVVQVCGERTWLRTEAALLTAIRERTSVPVPPVLAAGETDGVAYMVTAYVAGTDLHEQFTGLEPAQRRALARTFGEHLGALHEQFRFDGYGSLVVDDGELTAWRESWPAWLAEYGRSAVERLPAAFDPVREGVRALLAEPAVDTAPPARLFPWDFRPGNALVADGHLTAILDWEAPLAAAPGLAAAKAEYLVADWYVADPTPLREAFGEGYERVRPYPTVQPVHRAATIADSAVDSAGTVTNPGYPEMDREAAVAFHRRALADLL